MSEHTDTKNNEGAGNNFQIFVEFCKRKTVNFSTDSLTDPAQNSTILNKPQQLEKNPLDKDASVPLKVLFRATRRSEDVTAATRTEITWPSVGERPQKQNKSDIIKDLSSLKREMSSV